MADSATLNGHTAPEAVPTAPQLPWYTRYLRWRQTSHRESVEAEKKLLGLAGADLEIADVSVGPGKHNFMHTVMGGPPGAPTLVMIPGYGAGLGFFFRNFRALTSNFRMHAVDLLGTGLSGRPRFGAKSREEAERFFLDALSTWRREMGIGKMVLMGHSMGGYLAATYALQHPEEVEHLILVCPAGISKIPDDWQPPEVFRNPWSWRGQMYRIATGSWDAGLTPGVVIRGLGPWGPGIINGYVRRRFREGMGLSEAEGAAFQDYFYHIMAARGSGEHALRHILGPFAWARQPLEDKLRELKVPVTFIFGDHDWMDPKGAVRVVEHLRTLRSPVSPGDMKVDIIPNAGHYAFLDQPTLFKESVLRACEPYLSRDQKTALSRRRLTGGKSGEATSFPTQAENVQHVAGSDCDPEKTARQPRYSEDRQDSVTDEAMARASDP